MTEVRLTALGHPAITGRHGKTLELTAAAAVTARATCVLGVAAGPLPGGLPALRGRVRLRIQAGGAAAALEGDVNPSFASADRLVVRRSDQRDPDTFLVNASAAAADLPADLLAAVRAPGAGIAVTVAEIGTPPPVLLVLAPGAAPAPEVARLAAQADAVVDLTGRGAPAPEVPLTAPRRHGPPHGPVAGRTVAVLTEDLGPAAARAAAAVPGARVVVWPPVPGADLLLAAGRPAVPALHAGVLPATQAGRRDLARQLGAAGVPVVVDVPAAALPSVGVPVPAAPAWLAELRDNLPRHTLVLPDPVVGWGVGALPVASGGQVADLRGLRHAPRLVLLPPEGSRPLAVDPAELARLLRRAGCSGRDATAVLTGLGVSRKEAYRLAAESP